MECNGNWQICGFSMGPAFYGTDSVMTINTTAYTNINSYLFAQPWSGDPTPQAPQNSWGMDTSNVVPVNSTHGVAYAWEIWRGASDGSIVNRGNAVVSVTLGPNTPIATRLGPLLTGPSAIQLGLLAAISDSTYIYTYSAGGPSGLIVGRVPVSNDAAFTASNYQFLTYNSNPSAAASWVSSGIPASSSNTYGMTSGSAGGGFGCGVYGSAFYNNYLNKYMLVCDADMWFMNFFIADNPWGPWSTQYQLLNGGWEGYGTMAHPEFSPGGSHKELYVSQGPDGPFNMFKVTFDY